MPLSIKGTSHAFSLQKTTENVYDELIINQTGPPWKNSLRYILISVIVITPL